MAEIVNKKKSWMLEVSQNAWEYSGHIHILADDLVRVDDRSVLADGVLIEVDEDFIIH